MDATEAVSKGLNPDGTKPVPAERLRVGLTHVFYYKRDSGEAGADSVTVFEDEGDSMTELENGTYVFNITNPKPTTFVVRPTWDFMSRYTIKVKATPENAPWLFR